MFKKKSTVKFKIIIISIIIILCILINKYVYNTNIIKQLIKKKINFVYVLVNTPYCIFKNINDKFSSSQNIKKQNNYLYRKLLLQSINLFTLTTEKYNLEQINSITNLNINVNNNINKKIFGERIPILLPLYYDKIFINKGTTDYVSLGAIALNEIGFIGQIITTKKHNSEILLLCSTNSSISVRLKNNNVKLILNGTGCKYPITLKSTYIPENVNIKIGDILLTSELNNHYIINYPIGSVIKIINNKKLHANIIYVKPLVNIEQIKYLLLINFK
ncbi:rod shape-determining protein MreC [Enterobacteriaceae endosymbiont of Neohaemonia nigricornis]|uniref:rod shape-determining protein MreC n=1 Tax=Enterobacteriaceae endosymbiont of Neohaemonia nigricornis TaxID=2675792 RepID=UPI0014498C22|nr:rod shape-determining protein MreC [Enterobacteriaceae endosymbiont of Neohaemonia nigricornis]QJC30223.1 rod shape-determining protein MreC [Enterobacteriaceae endosymbiont of Neohaemonia nigricornis]